VATRSPTAAATPKHIGWRRHLVWVPVLPFFLYATAFLLVPSGSVLVGALQGSDGHFTLRYVRALFQGQYLLAFKNSIEISAVTALAGGIFGFLVAYAAAGGPRWLRPVLTTFSGVAANFAGVPLAFAFIATIGTTGLITRLLRDALGLDLQRTGFTLYSVTGLSLTYLYFQLPLMILIIMPAIDGLRREWREAAANLGASGFEYWRFVGLPVLLPSLLGAMVLLFGNAFSAYATPYALTYGVVNLVPMQIANVLQGNVLSDPQLGEALALGMIVVIAVSMSLYALLQRRSSRWLRVR
jgi:putative spermidine/putrescine transport system permease protein